MSETDSAPALPFVPAAAEAGAEMPTRPWHGTDNPLEALYSWTAEALDALTRRVAALEAPRPAPVASAPEAPPPAAA